MKLSQLIELTLNEISTGVRSAKEASREIMVIAPGTLNGKLVAEITYIEFDISVVVEETDAQSSSKDKEYGGELRVFAVGARGKAQNNQEESKATAAKATQRIAFKVPVCMGAEYY